MFHTYIALRQIRGAANLFCVIVDGYSTGAGLAAEFSKQGFSCIHVHSQPTIPKVYAHTYKSSDYCASYVYEGPINALATKLSAYRPRFVIPGAECGIELADSLAETLGVFSNGTTLSACRRDKHLMSVIIKSEGMNNIPSFCASTLDGALTWASARNGKKLVVKPLNSAGGEGVKICQSLQDVETACLDIFSTKINMLGFKNNKVLLQHYIEGEEYVINTVSYGGQHKLCELWQYTRLQRTSGEQIYDTATIVDYDPLVHKEVVDYAMDVITALGVKYGPAHVEIIKNNKGCFLVELGARLMGANLPFPLLAQCISTPQALMTVTAYADPEKFKQQCKLVYQVKQPLLALFMMSNHAGVVTSIHHLEKIQSCKSFFDMKLAVKLGGMLSTTADYKTSPGMIYLSHPDKSVIFSDMQYIRTLEKNMFTVMEAQKIESESVTSS